MSVDLMSSCESGGAALPDEVSESLREIGLTNEQVLIDFLKAEQKRGQLPSTAHPKEVAGYLLSVMYGLSVLARRGKTRKELKAIVDVSIKMLSTVEF